MVSMLDLSNRTAPSQSSTLSLPDALPISIDSVHSPVRKVNYTVEAARLGQITDYDKLTLEVWTNGSVLPADAIDRKSTRLNSSHPSISYAVFCLKKKI